MPDFINFFAYGEMVNETYFKEQGFEYNSKTNVTLSAYRVVFNKLPSDPNAPEGLGVVNIEPTPTNAGMMEGILYEMDEKYVPKLDEYYEYPKEYTRKVMRINRHDFITVNGIVYFAQPERVKAGLKPDKATMKILRGARKTMSMLYFSRLMGTRTID
ncbi:MAG: gamma-glutamylcyclotransferase [Candidatus Nitrohelix vancouverensis]|uniref:Gamma-glutamylcyclotransferase n=1 Tax=Candidatus Nitrohelix vancouverensis TaxID=2705534 RepID=A0A7T0C291_9BACT|nr:MAG: gamma-glutamylcyclotransferase [Candidatus Nitrohelix vancouverensis]